MAWIYIFPCLISLFVSVYSGCMNETYPDTYFQGTDLTAVFTPDSAFCQMVCTFHPRCLFYTFLPKEWTNAKERFACFLKEGDARIPERVPFKGAVSGHSLKQCQSQISACIENIYEGMDMLGINYNITTVENYKECERTCTNDPHCHFYTYVTNKFHSAGLRSKCYHKYTLTGTPKQIRLLDNVISGFSLKSCGRSETGCKTDIFQEMDFSGDNITSVSAPDKDMCRLICTYHPSCLFFTFFTMNMNIESQRNLCYLKTSKSGQPTAPTFHQHAISGFSQLSCKRILQDCYTTLHENLSFLGNDLGAVDVADRKACQETCTNTDRCQFFTYTSRPGSCFQDKCKCYLKMSENGMPSGIKQREGDFSGYSLRLCRTKVNIGCGQPDDKGRIVGGVNAKAKEWPWQVSLHAKLATVRHVCGGSIINNRWIVTAAHCVEQLKKPEQWRVYSGILQLSAINSQTPYFNVKKIIKHPLYHGTEYGYDVALFELTTSINYTEFQLPICLPPKDVNLESYESCYATGWGYTKEQGSVSDILQKALIPVVSREECQKNYRSYNITDSVLCAGFKEGGIDACKGDSGGPFACKRQGAWYLMGITSWGEGCARPGQPGVYTRVTEFRGWIENEIEQSQTTVGQPGNQTIKRN